MKRNNQIEQSFTQFRYATELNIDSDRHHIIKELVDK